MTRGVDGRGIEPAVLRFCRAARERGLLVGPAESSDAIRALTLIDVGDREEFRIALRGILTSSHADGGVFDELFREYFSRHERHETSDIPAPTLVRRTPPERRASFSMEGWLRNAPDSLDILETNASSEHEVLAAGSPPVLDASGLAEIARLARMLARRLANRPGRRWQPSARGTRLDLRRSLRRSIATDGMVLDLARRSRKARRLKVVALCDVSASMNLYTRFFLHFLRGLTQARTELETFVFATRLTRVTEYLTTDRLDEISSRLSDNVRDWGGGTRIGDSLAEAAHRWNALFDRHTIVLIMSDGWETGDPAILARALAGIRARVRKVVWLNPLLGSSGFTPSTLGMSTALPHVDHFEPLNDLSSLRELVRSLARSPL